MTPEQLKAWRKRSGYTQEEFAQILGVTKTTVYRWEAAMREIPPFLALTLECVEKKKGGEQNRQGTMKTKRKGERNYGKRV
ncbi:MAG: helix-turn-helix transcriptional regulator [Alphaproteobacteria bacterium]|uniref:Helix-turn-helix transcriptional regulator n=1 Tax=Candidatus Nitrobium versatile TaxID=2884831 RepID=A0A953J4E2_9BACT|nr:helix-turn-helix transcriptional regulator [Candidatus Nitrobium versatile]